ncbi:hypothetical protein N8I77_001556 [Diaporthe amygdali]|uniref:1,3-beta-glucanosyltransferase n=1 Tax=Phomopsis amygdali TaxID=1214568 RepID=A0AAD9SS93_PHOAM|nr:hypothetical protein N8I77_001556 [Diaporthe amygdali]
MPAESRNFYPNLQRQVTATASGSNVVSYSSELGEDKPILTLIHGYPQSSFIWRNVIPKLSKEVSLFVPELPGYGISSPARSSAPRDIGGALLEALQSVFKLSGSSPRRLILGGHDRGARICHRLTVSKADFPFVKVIGVVLMDIVPTKVQWDNFSNPAVATGYFHWPLLANVEVAVQMIKAYGGAQWCRNAHMRLAGSKEGLARIQSDNAIEIHAELFDEEETLRHTCEDYAAGAAPEYKKQEDDQKAGIKIDVPTLVMFSQQNLGAKMNVAGIWKNDWIEAGVWYDSVADSGSERGEQKGLTSLVSAVIAAWMHVHSMLGDSTTLPGENESNELRGVKGIKMSKPVRSVDVKGRYFWVDGKRLLIKGVVYQDRSRLSDPLSDDGIVDLRRDLEVFEELGLNTLFVYQVDHTKNHDAAMKLLEDSGIYVLVCLCTPECSINRLAPLESYSQDLLGHYFSTVDAMATYSNTLGVLVANEVINDQASTAAAPVIRAVTRDIKRYMTLAHEASEQRILPIGYSAADVRMYTRASFDYLTADSVDESIDFFCFNNYSWAGRNSSMKISGYDQLVNEFSDTHIPVFFSEYGCNTVKPRVFHETTAIYSPEMTHVFSGGCVYEFHQGPSNYGIIKTSQLPDGSHGLVKTDEFKTLKKRLQGCTEQPSSVETPETDQAVAATHAFPELSNTWRASSDVPPSPIDWEAVCSQLDLRSWVVLRDDMQRGGTVLRQADDFNLRL